MHFNYIFTLRRIGSLQREGINYTQSDLIVKYSVPGEPDFILPTNSKVLFPQYGQLKNEISGIFLSILCRDVR